MESVFAPENDPFLLQRKTYCRRSVVVWKATKYFGSILESALEWKY